MKAGLLRPYSYDELRALPAQFVAALMDVWEIMREVKGEGGGKGSGGTPEQAAEQELGLAEASSA